MANNNPSSTQPGKQPEKIFKIPVASYQGGFSREVTKGPNPNLQRVKRTITYDQMPHFDLSETQAMIDDVAQAIADARKNKNPTTNPAEPQNTSSTLFHDSEPIHDMFASIQHMAFQASQDEANSHTSLTDIQKKAIEQLQQYSEGSPTESRTKTEKINSPLIPSDPARVRNILFSCLHPENSELYDAILASKFSDDLMNCFLEYFNRSILLDICNGSLSQKKAAANELTKIIESSYKPKEEILASCRSILEKYPVQKPLQTLKSIHPTTGVSANNPSGKNNLSKEAESIINQTFKYTNEHDKRTRDVLIETGLMHLIFNVHKNDLSFAKDILELIMDLPPADFLTGKTIPKKVIQKLEEAIVHSNTSNRLPIANLLSELEQF